MLFSLLPANVWINLRVPVGYSDGGSPIYKSLVLFVVLFFGVFAQTAAYASTLTAAELLGGFNAIIFHDAATTADIEGAAIIGGSFSGATMYSRPGGVVLPDSFNALNVYGNTYGNPINLNNGGSASVGGSKGAIVNFNGGGRYVSSGTGVSMDEIASELIDFSSYLTGLDGNSLLPTPDNNEVIQATPDANGVAVFNISVDDLSRIPSYSIDLNGATSIIFNVSGPVLGFNANYQGDDSIFDNVIWNFYDATDLTFGTLIGGSVLAPYAAVRNNNQIDGTLVANSWTGSGELHQYAFDDQEPVSDDPGPIATPEPSSLLLVVCGVALFLARRWWHRGRGIA